MKFGLFIFPGAEELDFVGPWEVITSSVQVRFKGEVPEGEAFIIAETADPVRCAKGMRVVPDYTIDNAPDFDVLLIPGGMGTRTLASMVVHASMEETGWGPVQTDSQRKTGLPQETSLP